MFQRMETPMQNRKISGSRNESIVSISTTQQSATAMAT